MRRAYMMAMGRAGGEKEQPCTAAGCGTGEGTWGTTEGHRDARDAMDGRWGMEEFARALMIGDGFRRYVENHGYHFTPELADEVTTLYMENADGTLHHWTAEQVKNAMIAAGMRNNPLRMTWGDAAYLANWYYSDEYPEEIGTENGCIERAYKAAQDPDGYEGMTFIRWLGDVVGKRIRIEWERFA